MSEQGEHHGASDNAVSPLELQDLQQQIAGLNRRLERLRQVEQRFEDFANSARDFAFITLDLHNCVIGWNAGAEQLVGYREAEILGQSGKVFFTPEDIVNGEADREIETAKAQGRAEDERWHVRKDGSRFWGSGVMTLLRDKAGEVIGYAKVMRDRTEERMRMEALRASEERFRLLIESMRDCALFSLDLQGNVSEWNSGAERIFGFTSSEALGRSAVDLIAADEETRQLLVTELADAAREGGAAAEAWLMRKGGARFYGRWVTNAMGDGAGQIVGFTKVLRDETEREHQDQKRKHQFQRDRELLEGQVHFTNSALDRTREELQNLAGQLLNAQDTERRQIARDLHDHLAQRLAVVEIKLQHLRKGFPGDLPAAQSELESIQQHVSDLSNEVRDISHRLHPSTLEHIGVVAAMKSLVEEFSHHRTTPVHFDNADFFEEGLEPEVRGVLYRISEEAFRNVQRHAGDVPVSVTLYRSPGAVHLEIRDRGAGFSQNAITDRRTLGLISMAERARLVGGTFELTSVPGEGTTLEIAVPISGEVYEAAAGSSGR